MAGVGFGDLTVGTKEDCFRAFNKVSKRLDKLASGGGALTIGRALFKFSEVNLTCRQRIPEDVCGL